MHIFLQGPRNIGKSTVIRKTLEILTVRAPVGLGGFFTWKSGDNDPNVYMRPAEAGREGEIFKLAGLNEQGRGMTPDILSFDRDGVRLLRERRPRSETADDNAGIQLIIMDELGYLEKDALEFRRAVLDTLAGETPVFGVLRMGDIAWHEQIKRNPKVTLYEVNIENRDELPRELAEIIQRGIL